MKDEEKRFIKNWEESRKKGEYKYILTTATVFGTAPLAGLLFANIVLYSPSNAYSLAKDLPTYLLVYFGAFMGAWIKAMYTWNKNEERYAKLLNIDQS